MVKALLYKSFYLQAILTFLLYVSAANAQEAAGGLSQNTGLIPAPYSRIHYGITAGWNYTNHDTKFQENILQDFTLQGWYSGIQLGVTVEYKQYMSVGIAYQLDINYFHSNLVNSKIDGPWPVSGDTSVVIATFENKSETRVSGISLSPCIKVRLFNQAYLRFGASLYYMDFTNIKSTVNIVSPDYFKFKPVTGKLYENDYKTAVIDNNEIPNSNKINVSLNFGVQYAINLKTVSINPFVNYKFYLLKLTETYNWKISELNIGADVLFNFEKKITGQVERWN